MDLDLRQLRYFIKVAERLNFTEAANELFVAQSAVSQQIAELEKKIGVPLFIRNKRFVRLTSAGQRLYQDVVPLMHRMEEAIHTARLVHEGLVGALRIGFLAPHVRAFLPDLIKEFKRQYPDIDLTLNHYHHGMLLQYIDAGELDLAITTPFGLHRVEGIVQEVIRTEPFAVVLHRNHPLASRDRLQISDLRHEPFIIHNRQDSPAGFFDYTIQLCSRHGFVPNIVSQPRFVDTVLVLVEAELGIAILPQSLEHHYSAPDLRFIPIADAENDVLQLVMVWKENHNNPSLPLWVNTCRKVLGSKIPKGTREQ
ncbi:LysR family transcriptional regulator [Alicyclobacillus vulcanalis]|uniref:DNA-binding transcriptional regulator, LysR family n=1 Tax=Alicyclobacillus vulcanalis TaxID=252246 RepID=A0A1N7NX33_9BACL|nr:LysR family transcriptional regulator [Alicyclobacillus vulcanalis]SIT02935.1 DNA-binding transcriptional regulator, LysR family [Alicyclobacillus vulcanalis]